MAGVNDFLLWGTDANANVLTQQQYNDLATRLLGVVKGKASAQQANKAWRQSSLISRMIMQFVIDTLGTVDAIDDGTIAQLQSNFKAAVAATFHIPNTGVAPGNYPQCNLTVQADGRLTFAANGRNANYANDIGTVPNIYIANLNPPPPTLASLNGVPINIKIAHTSTGASTLQMNGFTATPITDAGGNTSILRSPLLAGVIYTFMYDGTSFQLLSRNALRPLHGSIYYTTTGATSFTVPADVYQIYVEIWGAGGGGCGRLGSSGAGGGYSAGWISVTPGQVITGSVGVGGAPSTYPTPAGAGGATTFGSLLAGGGTGGGGGPGAGGNGSGGDISISGQGGSDIDDDPAGPYSHGSTGAAHGGDAPRGGMGGTMNAGGAGIGPTQPGGGGAANVNASVGQQGAHGAIYVKW